MSSPDSPVRVRVEDGVGVVTLAGDHANAVDTGVLPAVITAVETIDRCLARIVAAAARHGTRVLITADHGNYELMVDPKSGGPHTAHTTNPVPLVTVGADLRLRSGGALCDVAPTIFQLLGVDQPPEMTGRSLPE